MAAASRIHAEVRHVKAAHASAEERLQQVELQFQVHRSGVRDLQSGISGQTTRQGIGDDCRRGWLAPSRVDVPMKTALKAG